MNWDEIFTYDPINGELWRKKKPRHFPHPRAEGSKQFRSIKNKAYKNQVAISVNGKSIGAHRIIWELHYGPIPDGHVVDHIDGDPFNNRINNLRLATRSQNQMNRRRSSSSRMPYKGITRSTSGKYYAQIKVGETHLVSASFVTPEEAHAAYREMAIEHFGEFARFD